MSFTEKQNNKKKIRTSLFIDPTIKNIKLSKKIGAKCVELHTGKISRLVKDNKNYSNELDKIKKCSKFGIVNNINVIKICFMKLI